MTETLTILFSWLLALLTWAPVGLWTLQKLNALLDEKPIHNFIIAITAGAAINSALLAVISFWFPVNIYTGSFLWLTSILLFGKLYRSHLKLVMSEIWSWSLLSKIGFTLLAVITFVVTAHQSLNNDSGLYYIQFIKWINSYPVVPGLANLHDRFGFNSHWHLLSAAFNVNIFVQTGTNDLNGLLFILFGLGSFASAEKLKSQPDLFNAIWALFPLPFFLLTRFLTSEAPDLPSTLIPLIYFSLLVSKREKISLPLIILLIAFAATIKVMSAIHVIGAIPLFALLARHGNWKSIGSAIALGIFIALPWSIRNVIQTGYPVFPMESLDLFNFDWKVPAELAGNARKMVDIHARSGNYDLGNNGKPISDWFPFWLSVQSKSVLGLLVFVLASCFLLVPADLLMIDRHRGTNKVLFNLFIALSVLVSYLFWWKSGPNPRFIYGTVFFFFAFALGSLFARMKLAQHLRFVPILALLPILVITRAVLLDPGPERPIEFSSFSTEDNVIYFPTNTDKCWEHDLPCTTEERSDLELRGENLADGFRNTSLQVQ